MQTSVTLLRPLSGAGSAWAWCGSISGCGNVTYQTCELKNSTAQSNTTAPDGFLNFVQGGVRYTSGGGPHGLNACMVHGSPYRGCCSVRTISQ